MWTREIMGMDMLGIVQAFITYSMLGWLVESIYMSICNKRLTNRGFAKGPFCPIYGFGAVLGYMILHPLAENKVALYVAGAVIATIFEFFVARLMEKTLGDVWWDYSEKPLNYKGVICAESTIAWGFYAVIIITFLFDKVMSFVDRYPVAWGIKTITLIFVMIALDFLYHVFVALDINMGQYVDKMKETYRAFRAKW